MVEGSEAALVSLLTGTGRTRVDHGKTGSASLGYLVTEPRKNGAFLNVCIGNGTFSIAALPGESVLETWSPESPFVSRHAASIITVARVLEKDVRKMIYGF